MDPAAEIATGLTMSNAALIALFSAITGAIGTIINRRTTKAKEELEESAAQFRREANAEHATMRQEFARHLTELESRRKDATAESERRMIERHNDAMTQIKPHEIHTRIGIIERTVLEHEQRFQTIGAGLREDIGKVSGQISEMSKTITVELSGLRQRFHESEIAKTKQETDLAARIERAEKDVEQLYRRWSGVGTRPEMS